MNAMSRTDRFSGDAKVAGTWRSRLYGLPMRLLFLTKHKNPELLPLIAADCAWGRLKERNRGSRIEAECLTVFNQAADLSTYRRGKSVRTTRATSYILNYFSSGFCIVFSVIPFSILIFIGLNLPLLTNTGITVVSTVVSRLSLLPLQTCTLRLWRHCPVPAELALGLTTISVRAVLIELAHDDSMKSGTVIGFQEQ